MPFPLTLLPPLAFFHYFCFTKGAAGGRGAIAVLFAHQMERPVPDPILLRTDTCREKSIVPHTTLPTHQRYVDVLRENRSLQDELNHARGRISELEDTLSTLLAKGALPRYSLFLPPYFIAQHQSVIAAIEIYSEQYRESVRRGLLLTE